jgi:hypothetical protein
MHTGVPAQKLQTLMVMIVLSLRDLCRTTVIHHQSISGRWLKVTFARRVCHQNNHPRNLPTTFQYFQFVTWKFLSLSATALIGLSLTGVVRWAEPQ